MKLVGNERNMTATPRLIRRVVSGGQTGVDRGALDAAIDSGVEHGGWCPRGRVAEDGIIPARYRLAESDAREYWVRTEQNVIDSDGTLILYRQRLSGGTEFTRRMAIKHAKPYFLLDIDQAAPLEEVQAWIRQYHIQVLNCAGPRESSAPGIGQRARLLIANLLCWTLEPT